MILIWYWLIAGYGLGGLRALAALGVVMVTCCACSAPPTRPSPAVGPRPGQALSQRLRLRHG
jgi:hypothetical protein